MDRFEDFHQAKTFKWVHAVVLTKFELTKSPSLLQAEPQTIAKKFVPERVHMFIENHNRRKPLSSRQAKPRFLTCVGKSSLSLLFTNNEKIACFRG